MNELSAGQMAMYRIEKGGIGQMMLLCASVVLDRAYSDEELQYAANEVFRINDGLRAVFVEHENGKVYQDFMPYREQKFEVKHFDSKEKMHAWGQIYASTPLKLTVRSEGVGIPAETWKMFDVTPAMIIKGIASSIGPAITRARNGIKSENAVCAIKLVQLPSKSAVIIKMHHVVSDGWTMLLLGGQLIQLLHGETPKAYQYEEYLNNDQAYRQSKRYQKDRAFFEQEYAKLPFWDPEKNAHRADAAELTVWHTTPSNMTGARREVAIDVATSNRIKEYSAANRTSPANVILTAVAAYIQRRLGRNSFYLGSNSINRTGLKERNVAGLFINTLAQIVEIDPNDTFAEAVQSITASSYSYFRHQKGMDNNNFMIIPMALSTAYMDASFLNQMAGADIEIKEYFNQCTYGQYFASMDHGAGKCITMYFDYNLQMHPEKEVDELFDFLLAALKDGIADDSKKIGDLGVTLTIK